MCCGHGLFQLKEEYFEHSQSRDQPADFSRLANRCHLANPFFMSGNLVRSLLRAWRGWRGGGASAGHHGYSIVADLQLIALGRSHAAEQAGCSALADSAGASANCWLRAVSLSGINSVFHGGAASRIQTLGGCAGMVGLAWEHGTFSSSAMGSAEPLKRLIQPITGMHGGRFDSGAVRDSGLDVLVEADHLGRDPSDTQVHEP